MFAVQGANLFLVDRVTSGGAEPNAVAEHGDLVYVLNVRGCSNGVGFRLIGGHLQRIPNSMRFLTANNSEAASPAFSPDGPGKPPKEVNPLSNASAAALHTVGESTNLLIFRRSVRTAAAKYVSAMKPKLAVSEWVRSLSKPMM